MDAPTCQEPRRRWVNGVYPGPSWHQEFPCGRAATAWHHGRPMCRSCRSEALRREARERRAAGGGVLGSLANAAPDIVVWGFFVVGLVIAREHLWEVLSENRREFGFAAFVVLLWFALQRTDAWLVRSWRRWRKGAKGNRDSLRRREGSQADPRE